MKKLWQKIIDFFKAYMWMKWVALAGGIVIALTTM